VVVLSGADVFNNQETEQIFLVGLAIDAVGVGVVDIICFVGIINDCRIVICSGEYFLPVTFSHIFYEKRPSRPPPNPPTAPPSTAEGLISRVPRSSFAWACLPETRPNKFGRGTRIPPLHASPCHGSARGRPGRSATRHASAAQALGLLGQGGLLQGLGHVPLDEVVADAGGSGVDALEAGVDHGQGVGHVEEGVGHLLGQDFL
jgi:hypothetical protein